MPVKDDSLKDAQRQFQEEEKILQALIRLIDTRHPFHHPLPWETTAAQRMFRADLEKAHKGLGDAITECGHALASLSTRILDAKLAEDRARAENRAVAEARAEGRADAR